jgi:hypothetical protein
MRIASIILIALAAACGADATKEKFSFPTGDRDAGRQAFAELKCDYCHAVQGETFPAPRINPPVPVKLGANWTKPPTREFLVHSIIDPSHEITTDYKKELVTNAGVDSRMWDFSHIMTVRQLFDIVEFLHSLPPAKGVAQ